jgi:hypothetical protein
LWKKICTIINFNLIWFFSISASLYFHSMAFHFALIANFFNWLNYIFDYYYYLFWFGPWGGVGVFHCRMEIDLKIKFKIVFLFCIKYLKTHRKDRKKFPCKSIEVMFSKYLFEKILVLEWKTFFFLLCVLTLAIETLKNEQHASLQTKVLRTRRSKILLDSVLYCIELEKHDCIFINIFLFNCYF